MAQVSKCCRKTWSLWWVCLVIKITVYERFRLNRMLEKYLLSTQTEVDQSWKPLDKWGRKLLPAVTASGEWKINGTLTFFVCKLRFKSIGKYLNLRSVKCFWKSRGDEISYCMVKQIGIPNVPLLNIHILSFNKEWG